MPISYVYTGNPLTGTAGDDFMIGYAGTTGTSDNTVNAGEGDDWILGDSSGIWLTSSDYANSSIATAINIDLSDLWTVDENAMFGTSSTPHVTDLVEATIGQTEFFAVQIGAGQTITIDIDYGGNSPIGTRDLVAEIRNAGNTVLAANDDSLVSDGGYGSFPVPGSSITRDPYLIYTAASAGTYYINVRPLVGTFTANDIFVLNVSITGHAVFTPTVMGTDTLNGGGGDDQIFGQGGADTINGEAGNDVIHGGSGIDTINGGDDSDTLHGGEATEETVHGDNGNDILISGGEGHYYGDAGDDVVYAGPTSGVNEVLDGGTGIDTIDTTSFNGAYTVNLFAGTTSLGEFFTSFESAVTGDGADTVIGTAGANIISTRGGVDIVNAGAGDDIVAGGAGGDTLNGESDFDLLDYRASNSGVVIILSSNFATGGHAAGDVISNFEGAYGSGFADSLFGSAGDNRFYAMNGDDVVNGGDGNDSLDGGNGIDTLRGGIGNDTLDGGVGADFMEGDAGDDTYYVDNAADSIDVEGTGQGTDDRVFASASYALGAAAQIEWLATTDVAGTGAMILTGNDFAQVISGNDGDNILDGMGNSDTLYGNAGNDTLIGGGLAQDTLDGGAGQDVMVGGGGSDLYYVDNAADTITEGDGEGSGDQVFASASYALGAGAQIEILATTSITGTGAIDLTGNDFAQHLTGNDGDNSLDGMGDSDVLFGRAGNDILNGGTGNDTLNGGTGIDALNGGAGDDTLYGGAGIDALSGGAGDDIYTLEDAGDTATELPGEGNDSVSVAFTHSINASPDIENLGTIDAGAVTAINLTGNASNNQLTGNAGSNILDGRGGADTMKGGAGNDWYYIDQSGDSITNDGVGQGTNDRIFTAVSYVLAGGIQIESLAPTNLTATTPFDITGNAFVQVIYGNEGDNVLDGKGGADTMVGGNGNDTYYVDHANDAILSEGVGKGTNDRVFATVSYSLAPSVQIEILSFVDPAGTMALNFTGNELAQTLNGNAGDNILNGKGGADTMIGGAGNDWYYVDNPGDVVGGDGVGQGNDRVFASASFTLAAGVQVEMITTINPVSGLAINLTGNDFVQALYGNEGNNILDGKGGADSMFGGAGNDWYYVDDAGDVIGTEGFGEGINDRVFASVSYTLAAGLEIETLSTASNSGIDGLALTGNEFANTIYGNAGNNVIDGKAGNDTLQGLGGQNSYAFTAALGAGNVDTIVGFSVANDGIRLENAVFTGLAAGALAAGAFNTGAAASQADDRIVYNSATGALLFDADGVGGAAAVQFATLATGLALTAADFFVI